MSSDCENQSKSASESGSDSSTFTDSKYFHNFGGQRFQRYFERATIHWFRKSFSGKSYIRRFCWIVFSICVLAAFLQGIVQTSILFASVPTATTVFTDPVDNLTFPSVTICNINGYNLAFLEENNLTKIVDKAVYHNDPRRGDYYNCDPLVPDSFPSDEPLSETVYKSSQSLDSLIQDCHFLGQKCNESMFTDYLIPTGRCFVFNGGRNLSNYLTVNGTGFRNDLELALNVETDSFVGSISSEVGVLVSVHEPGSSGLVWETGMHVPVGHSAYIGVTNRQIEDRTDRALGNNKRECIYEKEAVNLSFFPGYDYSFRSCRANCIFKGIYDTCNCTWTNTTVEMNENAMNDNSSRLCTISDLCCIYNVLKFTSRCNCLRLCNRTEYELTPNYASFPSSKGMMQLQQKYDISEEKIRNDLLQVHVYYKSLSISREITTRSFLPNQLIASIGGYMGLYLGISIFSVVELLVVLFDYCKDRFKISEKNIKAGLKSCFSSMKGKCFNSYMKLRGRSRSGAISVENSSILEHLNDETNNC